MGNVVCMLLKMKDVAEKVQWCAKRKQFLEQVQSVTENIVAMAAKADANVADHIEQLVTEKYVLEQRLDELEETCKLRGSCIGSLNQREAENDRVIIMFREELQDAQAAIMELSSKHAKVEQSQCSAKIEALEQQFGKPDALIAASDVTMIGINVGDLNKSAVTALVIDSGVETVETSDDSSDNESVKSVLSNHSNVIQQCESPSPYAQRRAYAGRPALKCFFV